jgi:hypothetical protein
VLVVTGLASVGACRRYPVRTAYLPLAHCGWYGDLAMGRALIWTEKSIAAIPGAAGSRYDFAAFADVGRAEQSFQRVIAANF